MPYCLRYVVFFSHFFVLQRHCRWILEGIINTAPNPSRLSISRLLSKITENCKLRKAIFSAFYNISQRNFGILLILGCSFKLWWNFCLDLFRSKFSLLRKWSIAGEYRGIIKRKLIRGEYWIYSPIRTKETEQGEK
jgi:hypothetical protein